MGGRGASSGISVKGKPYGTEYTELHQSGNIKFVKYNDSTSAKTPMETMTKGRVYVTVNSQSTLKSVTYYDKNNKRFRQLDLDHSHNIKGDFNLSPKEQKMIDRVQKVWYYYNNRK